MTRLLRWPPCLIDSISSLLKQHAGMSTPMTCYAASRGRMSIQCAGASSAISPRTLKLDLGPEPQTLFGIRNTDTIVRITDYHMVAQSAPCIRLQPVWATAQKTILLLPSKQWVLLRLQCAHAGTSNSTEDLNDGREVSFMQESP